MSNSHPVNVAPKASGPCIPERSDVCRVAAASEVQLCQMSLGSRYFQRT